MVLNESSVKLATRVRLLGLSPDAVYAQVKGRRLRGIICLSRTIPRCLLAVARRQWLSMQFTSGNEATRSAQEDAT